MVLNTAHVVVVLPNVLVHAASDMNVKLANELMTAKRGEAMAGLRRDRS